MAGRGDVLRRIGLGSRTSHVGGCASSRDPASGSTYARRVPGRLIICATPIGNLEDASPRLRRAVAESDVVYAEDTRRSRILLDALDVRRPIRSFFAGNEVERAEELRGRLGAGATVAFICDAGMPAVADPGYGAVRAAIEAGATVSVVPGPSAVTAALAVSGLPTERFVFEGFLPRKGESRRARLVDLATEERTIVIFAATGRLVDDLADLAATLGEGRAVVVARELTKAFEEVWRGGLGEARRRWSDVVPRGEFTLVVSGHQPGPADLAAALARVAELEATGTPLSEAVRTIAEEAGMRRRLLYEAALRERS